MSPRWSAAAVSAVIPLVGIAAAVAVVVRNRHPGAAAAALAAVKTAVQTVENDPAGSSEPITLGVTLQRSDVWRISDLADLSSTGRFAAEPPGDAGLGAAVVAAGHEVVDLLSYTRNNFRADLDRALDGLTGLLRASQQTGAAALRAAMIAGGYDYAGLVRAIGVESAAGSSALLLVCATGYQIGNTGRSISSGPVRYEVGVQFIEGRWLVSEYQSLDSS